MEATGRDRSRLTLSREAADRLTSQTTYHPWAEVVAIVGFLDDLRSDRGSDGYLVEGLLADAVAELNGGA